MVLRCLVCSRVELVTKPLPLARQNTGIYFMVKIGALQFHNIRYRWVDLNILSIMIDLYDYIANYGTATRTRRFFLKQSLVTWELNVHEDVLVHKQ